MSQQTAVQCLTPEAGRLVVECVTTSLFQHYHLFQYLFEEQQSKLQIDLPVQSYNYHCICHMTLVSVFFSYLLHCVHLQLPVEVPPPRTSLCPPPLDEAMPLQLYERCLAPQPVVLDLQHSLSEETEVCVCIIVIMHVPVIMHYLHNM